MIKDLVSIIIPVYNRKTIIEEVVECSVNQTYKNIEVIIVDNNSTDGTYEFLKSKYEDNHSVCIYQNETNIGPVRNWKKCLEYAHGEFCKILWSDDLMENEFIEKAVNILRKENDIAFVYSKVSGAQVGMDRNYGITSYSLGRDGKYEKDIFLEKMCRFDGSVPLSPGCALFRTKDIKIVTEIPNDFEISYLDTGAGPDVLIYLFASKNYKYIYYLDDVLNYFRSHSGSISCSGIDLYYSYLTALLYFMTNILRNKKYKMMLLKNAIMHCVESGKTFIETYEIIKRCDKGISFLIFFILYEKEILAFIGK